MFGLEQDLEQSRRLGRLRALRSIASAPGPTVMMDGREYIMFASNDYLGFAGHPRLAEAAAAAARRWGTGAAAARLISGNTLLHDRLEQDLAAFKHTEAALLFSTGYMANLGIIASLAGPEDMIFSDELNHASIIDGCRLSRGRTAIYPHRDVASLGRMLQQAGQCRRRIIVTDGLFSMDGDIAPVPELLDTARRHGAALIVDDAHATGTLGPTGRGTLEHFGIEPSPEILLMGTLGKALGCFGAFFAGSAEARAFFINYARSFIFTTALPPPVLAAAHEALKVLRQDPERVRCLQDNAVYLRAGLRDIGLNTLGSCTHIVPVLVGSSEAAAAWAQRLFERGLFVGAVRPPAVAEGAARLRLTVLATHTRGHLDAALAALKETSEGICGS